MDAPVWVLPVLALVTAAGLVFFFQRLHRARRIEDTPTIPIRSAPQGLVELQGKAANLVDSPLFAPISGTACVWWSFRVEHRQQRGWQLVHSERSEALFRLVDGSGACLIDPEGADMRPSQVQVFGGGSNPVLGLAGANGLGAGWAVLGDLWAQQGERRVTESLILEGQPLYVHGWLETQRPELGLTHAERVREQIARWKRDPAQRARFDINGDGTLDAREFSALRAMAAREIEPTALPAELHVLRRPKPSGLFLVSAESESQLIRRYRWQAWGVLAALAALWLAWGWTLSDWP